MAQLRVKLAERKSADGSLLQQAVVDLAWIFLRLDDEFVEAWRALEEEFAFLREFAGSVSGLRQVLGGEFSQPFAAVDGHVDRGHSGDQRLVGTDVRGGLLAANVLLASGKGEH